MPSSEDTCVDRADTTLLIGGLWREGSGSVLGSWNPADGTLVDSFQTASEKDVTDAVTAAADAAGEWAAAGLSVRTGLLEAWADRLDSEADALAAAAVQELGATTDEARSEVADGVAALRAATTIDADGSPLGNVALVTASVSPVALPLSRLGAALAVGNTLVWQPPPHASVVATTLTRLAHFPAGVLNVVLGSDDVAVALARADIAGFHIIGTPSLARWLCREALEVGGRVVAEVSGSAVAIVLAGANPEDAAERITRSAFAFAGQRSGAIKRVVVESRVAEPFLELLSDQVSRLKVGDPADTSVMMGPLRDAPSVQRAKEFVDARTAAGAPCHVGGAAMPELGDAFFEPTLLGPSTRQELLTTVMGPVITLVDVDDPGSLPLQAGAPLAACILGGDRQTARQIATALATPHVRVGSLPPDNVYETLFGQRALIPGDTPYCPLTRTEEIGT
jgi:acyl-CoA reductase-like NAD-dependent aldehyde dehydrogenase